MIILFFKLVNKTINQQVMKKCVLVLVLTLTVLSAKSQDTTKLLIELSPYDYPFTKIAYKNFGLYGLTSPSMYQSLHTTESFFNAFYYAYNQIIKKTTTTNKLTNYLTQLAGLYLIQIPLEYFPGGDGWLHEEFHRSILTFHNIYSFDEVYHFPVFASTINVDHVKDEDLIAFKKNYPSDFVRVSEAGIEGEYLLIDQLQKRSFFLNQPFPYWLSEFSITLNDIFYVFMCHTDLAIEETDEFNKKETNIEKRDFIGLDFTAWSYDLFNPDTPYQARGIHPSGIGLDRYIKPNDLQPEAYNYLKLQGYLQFINLLSPFLIGINDIQLANNIKFNFSFRHILTSFGNDISFNLFIKKQTNYFFSIHFMSNKNYVLPGLGVELYRTKIKRGFITYKAFFGLQPKNLMYYDAQIMPVGFTELRYEKFFNNFGTFISLDFKSKGWIQGQISQDSYASFNIGLIFKK